MMSGWGGSRWGGRCGEHRRDLAASPGPCSITRSLQHHRDLAASPGPCSIAGTLQHREHQAGRGWDKSSWATWHPPPKVLQVEENPRLLQK